jgi:hypothetical protein
MKRRALARLSWLCLVLQLVGAGATFGRVLCVATDGHVAVVIGHAGACDTEARRHHGEEPTGIAACAEHGCMDIAFSLPALRSSHDAIAPTPALVASPLVAHAARVAWAPSRPSAVSPSDDAVHARRSIVLLV